MTTTPAPVADRPRTVVIVMFDEVQSLDVTGPLEVLTAAGRAARPDPGYRVLTASLDGRPVRTSSGLVLTPHADLRELPGLDRAQPDVTALDLLLVAGGSGGRAPGTDLVAWVRKLAPRARRVASVCTGAFVLAEAGLLTGRAATTHWASCAEFARRFPEVALRPDALFVRDGNVLTSGGVTAGVDLTLALVAEDLGREVALTVARHLLVDLRRPGGQAPFGTGPVPGRSQPATHAGPLAELRQWIDGHPAEDLSVAALAKRVSLSERQLTRAFQTEAGMPPGRYVDEARLRAACRLLEETSDGVESVARRSGYGSAEAMRRAFARSVGIPPSEYRRRF
ncbi:GlxA family transcriptional regulator [Frankia sp. AgB1.9]|uniref:GlxA family transcriptional regulator n=1 Tax=unclassified Frankia TaxID=2632575 RepID=UPI00193270CC|nr:MULTISPECIES: GlxA family transcriptional regulator [unclassified Frankia]MBL7489334.1 GlxA family transcriptional regulator [Frankia sp. AgW1.1]MBL7549411.1 GlxA family transcriptional regulator [Frankia sp. AgB1.9]MBL7623101.1 GlxA family transcriptional regulator [Frankia sp. AgB1.8]